MKQTPMTRNLPLLLASTVLLVVGAASALAQQAGSPFAGFSANRDKPINFEADRAEVFDAERRAVLTGNVRVKQGDSTLATRKLTIFYEQRGSGAGQPAQTGQGGTQNVRLMQMDGGVIVSSKDQHATSERGSFDARANVAILEGNVVLTQCQNVMRGTRMVADLNTNRVRLEGGATSGGRVSGLLNGGAGGGCAPAPSGGRGGGG